MKFNYDMERVILFFIYVGPIAVYSAETSLNSTTVPKEIKELFDAAKDSSKQMERSFPKGNLQNHFPRLW